MITILACQLWTAIAGTWDMFIDALQSLNYYCCNTVPVINDEVNFPVFLSAGTYTFSLMGLTHSNGAIVTIYIDSQVIDTYDMYSAAITRNVERKVTGVVIATSGAKTLRLKATSKNGASTSYRIYASSIELVRTA